VLRTGGEGEVLKLVVCDLDGTLYPDHQIGAYVDCEIDKLLEPFLVGFPGGKARLVSEYPSVIDAFGLAQIPLEKLIDVYRSIPDPLDVERDPRLVEGLRRLAADGVFRAVVSLAPAVHINRLLRALGLERSFNVVISVADRDADSKAAAYERLATTFEAEPRHVLVIGNDAAVDLLPARELGFSTALVDGTEYACAADAIGYALRLMKNSD
jgi:FMN phosphatase YigB (HAD superfamily)